MSNEMTRRSFVSAAAAMGAIGIASNAVVEVEKAGAVESPAGYDAFAEDYKKRGGTTMSLAELNYRRQQLVDASTEYVCEDGTVIPEVYVKLRTLVCTYSFGLGTQVSDHSFDFFMWAFSEDEAAAYLTMPMGVLFTAQDWSQLSGRPEEECLAIADDLAERGLLWRAIRQGMRYFHQIPVMHGMAEYNMQNYNDPEFWVNYSPLKSPDFKEALMTSGTPFYRPIPVSADIVSDPEILPEDDWHKIIERNDIIGVSPCQCRRGRMILSGMDPLPPDNGDPELRDFDSVLCGHPLETCITTGEEAEYYISRGIARQIDKEEAERIFERAIDAGLVIESMFTRDSEVVCMCHGDCCTILTSYLALGPDFCATASCYPNLSDYVLEYDADACVKCGACAERCPMFAITMDGEDGRPQVNPSCVRCGQCGLVCPVHARTLAAKPAEERAVIPSTALDDYNQLAGYRFEHGMFDQA